MTGAGGITVRVAVPADAPALLPLFQRFYGRFLEVPNADGIASRLTAAAPVDTVLMAESGGRAAGFASVRVIPQIESHRPHAELSDIYVAETQRRRGVGRALMAHAERLARERGCPRIHLTAGLENREALAFYRALGYSEFGITLFRDLGGTR